MSPARSARLHPSSWKKGEDPMSSINDTRVLLTVRGTTRPATLDACRTLHNSTAGSKEGIAMARSLGDLSHKVYVPIPSLGDASGVKTGELLFIDVWKAPDGL